MAWKLFLQVNIREFYRQHSDVEAHALELLNRLRDKYTVRVTEQDSTQFVWPIKPSDVEQAQKNGFFVIYTDGKPQLSIYDLPVRIITDSYEQSEEIAEDVRNICGKACIVLQIVKEYILDNGVAY